MINILTEHDQHAPVNKPRLVICEEAKAGRCKACPAESKPHEETEFVAWGVLAKCTTPSKCYHMGCLVKCVPVDPEVAGE